MKKCYCLFQSIRTINYYEEETVPSFVDTALHELINVIGKSLDLKKYTMAAFLDIEGGFNNKELSTIIEPLQHGGIGDMVCK